MKRKTAVTLLCVLLMTGLLAGCAQKGSLISTQSALDELASEVNQPEAVQAPALNSESSVVSAPAVPAAAEAAAPEPGANLAESPTETQAEVTADAVEETQPDAAVLTPEAVQQEASAAAEEAPASLPDGQMYSYLTGEPVSTETGMKRPFAVMINNLEPAIPQSGIAKADIMYEAMVEGSITRLMAVFQDISTVGQLGPVRSSRHYYLYMSDEWNAIYTHFGWSPFAQSIIENEGRQTINGMDYDGDGNFYRTSDREAPHNAYVTGQGLINIATDRGMSLVQSDSFHSGMKFRTAEMVPENGEEALRVNIPFSWDTPYFVYDENEKVYYRYEYGAPHIDMETNEQLNFKNIIVLYVAQQVISEYGHLEIGLYGTMDGLYITDGRAIPIKGKRPNYEDKTQYYDLDGNEILINPGKTMIEYVPDDCRVTFGDESPVIGDGYDSSNVGVEAAEEDVWVEDTWTPEPVYDDTVYYDNGYDAGTDTWVDNTVYYDDTAYADGGTGETW